MTRQIPEEAEFAPEPQWHEETRQKIDLMEQSTEAVANAFIKEKLAKAFPNRPYKLAVKCAIAYSLVWLDEEQT